MLLTFKLMGYLVIVYILSLYNIKPQRDIVDWGIIMSAVLFIDVFSYFIGYYSDREKEKEKK